MTQLEFGDNFISGAYTSIFGRPIIDGITQGSNPDWRENILEPFARSNLLLIQSKWQDPQQDKGTFERDLKRV